MSQAFEQLNEYLEKAQALKTALVLFEWDDATLAPKEAGAYTSRMVGVLSSEYQKTMSNPQVKELVEQCGDDNSLSEIQSGIVREVKKELERLECIPPEEYRRYSELTSEGTRVWTEAKEKKDFDRFAPFLEEIISYQKKFASYQAKEGQSIYNVMLDHYEEGFDTEILDQFFNTLKEELVPFLHQIMESGVEIDQKILTGDFPNEKQEEIGRYLAEYVGFDFNKGVMAVSAHPFTTNLHNHDVRITTAYNNRVDDSMFSVIHESGHGIYEMGIPDELTQTPLGEGTSMGMHECQSRFFENIIGRSEAFWVPIYGKVQELFPRQLGDVTLEQFVRAVNKVQPSLIRTQADELTYSLHILIRYEIEKQLMEGDLEVKDLPEVWADKYEEYLGVRPANAAEGVLQDIHWSMGDFGYFPSYALGSAFGAQIYAYMKTQMDFEGLLREGKISVIREFLRENIHKYGKMKTSRQILKDVTGEDFNPKYYVEYLKEKYSNIYQL